MSRIAPLMLAAAAASICTRHGLDAHVAGPAEPDCLLFGPQVPTENPVNWIAERAPPAA